MEWEWQETGQKDAIYIYIGHPEKVEQKGLDQNLTRPAWAGSSHFTEKIQEMQSQEGKGDYRTDVNHT